MCNELIKPLDSIACLFYYCTYDWKMLKSCVHIYTRTHGILKSYEYLCRQKQLQSLGANNYITLTFVVAT